MKKIHLEIIFGTVFILISALLLAIMAVKEQDRLGEEGRLSAYEGQQRASQIEFGAGIYETNCTSCHGEYGQGIPGKAPCLRCEELFSARMEEIGWQGSLEEYVESVVTTGRQGSTRPELYQGEGLVSPVMPTWSEAFGGPLREDQVKSVAAFVANFEEWGLNPELVPTPVIALPPDDPTALGRLVFVQQGCIGCHTVEGLSTATTGPVLNGLADRAGSTVDGMDAEEYIKNSIKNPSDYVVSEFNDGLMPANFSELITDEEMDLLLSFLLTLSE